MKRSIKAIILLILSLFLFSGCSVQNGPQKKSVSGKLEVHYIDVGQGDATLIKCEDEYMLIDAGDNTCGTKVQHYLQKQGVDKLKYVIGTHPGADHIGGMDVIVYKFDCEKIFLTDKADASSQNTKSYQELLETIEAKSQKAVFPQVGQSYTLGGGSFTILSPSKAYEDSNDASIVIKFTYDNCSFLFTGDATAEAEKDMLATGMDVSADVYKVGHHGSNSSSCREFLSVVHPTYGVISCGADNAYGHPTKGTLQKLKDAGISVFRTDEQGTIIAVSDGKTIEWNCVPSTTWAAGKKSDDTSKQQARSTDTPSDVAKGTAYVLNTKTMKFHLPTCSGILGMSSKNRKDVDWSREKCIDEGYDPCGSCKP